MIDVLCSGGLDSWIHLNWAIEKFGKANVRPVYYVCGQACAEREWTAATNLCYRVGLTLEIIKIGPLQENRATGHVGFRNLHFLLHAAMREDSNGVVFGMLLGEDSEDKTPKFVRQMQELIDGQLAANWHHEKREFKIYTPYSKYTKTQMLSKFLVDSNSPRHSYAESANLFAGIYDSVACYNVGGLPCGECMSCYNRLVALTCNHLIGEKHLHHSAEYMLNRIVGILKNRSIDVPRANTLTRKWYSRAAVLWLYETWYALHRYTRHTYKRGVYRELRARL